MASNDPTPPWVLTPAQVAGAMKVPTSGMPSQPLPKQGLAGVMQMGGGDLTGVGYGTYGGGGQPSLFGNWLGTQFPFNWLGTQWPFNRGSSDPSASATPPATPPPTTAASTAGPTTSPTDDALNMGIGMFFSQYLAPMIAQQNQANTAMIDQYGQAMNAAMGPGGSNLPPEMRGIMQAQVPSTQQQLQMLNKAGEQQAFGTIPYQQFVQGLGADTAARSALTDAFTKLATASLYGGTTQPLSQALQAQFPAGSLERAEAGVIGQSTGANLAGLGGSQPTTGTTGQGITPQQWATYDPQTQAYLKQLGLNPPGT